MQQHEELDRYARYWSWVARLTRSQQHGICCYPNCKRCIWQVHHAVYQELNEWGELVPLKGREKPGVHCFGLCKHHHSRYTRHGAHHPLNWIPGLQPPDLLDARNTPDYYKLLVLGFREKTCGLPKTNGNFLVKTSN